MVKHRLNNSILGWEPLLVSFLRLFPDLIEFLFFWAFSLVAPSFARYFRFLFAFSGFDGKFLGVFIGGCPVLGTSGPEPWDRASGEFSECRGTEVVFVIVNMVSLYLIYSFYHLVPLLQNTATPAPESRVREEVLLWGWGWGGGGGNRVWKSSCSVHRRYHDGLIQAAVFNGVPSSEMRAVQTMATVHLMSSAALADSFPLPLR